MSGGSFDNALTIFTPLNAVVTLKCEAGQPRLLRTAGCAVVHEHPFVTPAQRYLKQEGQMTLKHQPASNPERWKALNVFLPNLGSEMVFNVVEVMPLGVIRTQDTCFQKIGDSLVVTVADGTVEPDDLAMIEIAVPPGTVVSFI